MDNLLDTKTTKNEVFHCPSCNHDVFTKVESEKNSNKTVCICNHCGLSVELKERPLESLPFNAKSLLQLDDYNDRIIEKSKVILSWFKDNVKDDSGIEYHLDGKFYIDNVNLETEAIMIMVIEIVDNVPHYYQYELPFEWIFNDNFQDYIRGV